MSDSGDDTDLQLTVVYDDGSFQAWADAEFGPDVVAVTSALQPVSPQ